MIFLASGYAGNILIDDITSEQIVSHQPVLSEVDSMCDGEQSVLNAYSPGADSYEWNTGETQSAIEVAQSGNYIVTIKDDNCRMQFSKEILVKERPSVSLGKDTVLYYGNNFFEIVASYSPQDASLQWDTGEQTASVAVQETGTYQVMVSNECGTDRESIDVMFQPLYIPNVVTDNNDGKNDKFFISGIEPGKWRLQIFNRWGELVYDDPAYRNTWPATEVTSGVYYFLLRGSDDKQIFRDFIHVILN
jgi:gliding motility-associated-like protein